MAQAVKVKSVEHLTHDVLKIVAEKPKGLTFRPGQAVDVSINKPGWEKELRPFTFTSLPEDNFIEFNIKTYPAHKGVTHQLLSLKTDDELLIGEVFGDIGYKGPGIFIAGGAGITPFVSILRYLQKKNQIKGHKLIFGNKAKRDIIHEEWFKNILGKDFINVLSEEKISEYEYGYINAEIIKKYKDENTKYFYLCGPDPMMNAIEKHLESLGIPKSAIVREGF